MKAYLIARVSTEDQEDALPGQVHRLEDYATRNHYEVVTYKLLESAFKEGRKLFAAIVEEISQEPQKVAVVFDKIDRYSRDITSRETQALRKLCLNNRIEIHFPSDSLIVRHDSSAQVWFMLGMGEVSGEYYARADSDNVKRRFQQMRRDGLWTGKAPFGYINVTLENTKKWIIIDPQASEIVRTAYQKYATGVSSLKLIRKFLKDEYAVSISNAQLDRILHNPFYKGIMRVDGKLFPHKYERIISEKLFDDVEAVRNGYKVKPTIYAGLPYVYRGLIQCAECGCRITFEQKKQKYIYGHCTQTKGKHGAAYVNEDELTQQFATTFKRIAIPEEAYVEVSQSLRLLSEQDKSQQAEKLGVINAEIQKYNGRLEKMYDDRLDGSISPELYDKKFKEFTEAKQALKKHRDKFELIAEDTFSSIEHLLKLSRNAPRLFEKGKIDLKRELIKMTHSNLELNGKELRWKLKRPFEMMAFCNETQNWLGRRDSNPRMPVPKTGALPLGHAPLIKLLARP